MSDLLTPRDHYKPHNYPWAYSYFKKQRAIAWEPHEAPMMDDVKDWKLKLNDSERSLLTQLFRFFTQADVDIGRGYVEKYLPRFPHPEVRMMLGAILDAEANHIDAYSTLMDTLGISEGEYKAFQKIAVMRAKHEYMFERETGKSIADLCVDLACFSAFGEGMQLFSSFAILMSFQTRGLMKGMTTIVEWSIRDESLHVEAMMKVFHTLIGEHPRVWNDETKQRIYDTCRAMVKLEDAFIDGAFSVGEVVGVTAADAKRYIRYIADRRLLQLGLKSNYHVRENPFPWLDWIMNAPTHTNFFEQRSTEYGKGEIEGWDRAFNFLDGGPAKDGGTYLGRRNAAAIMALADHTPHQVLPAMTVRPALPLAKPQIITKDPRYIVYTKPDCVHCTRAKAALDARGVPYDAWLLDNDAERMAMLRMVPGWRTFPMVFSAHGYGQIKAFVGGADALIKELANAPA